MKELECRLRGDKWPLPKYGGDKLKPELECGGGANGKDWWPKRYEEPIRPS